MPAPSMRRPSARGLVNVLLVVIAIALLTVGLRVFVVQAFVVPSPSMTPTLQVGDRIAVDKLSGTIRRGDIVVFHRAPGDHDPQYPVLVKRVIGLPGDTISQRGLTITIDGVPVRQPWLPRQTGICAAPSETVVTQRIPAGHYFVMGDCRGDSSDSRFWGTVPSDHIIGKVQAIVWHNGHPWFHWF